MKSGKITIYFIIYLLAFANIEFISAQCLDLGPAHRRKASYDAFVNHKMDKWIPLMTEIETMESPTINEKLELVRYYYGYSAYLIGMKKNKTAKTYVNKGDKLINQILKENPGHASALAFKGSFTGFKVVLNKFKIITMGPESIRYINRAYKADPNDIQAITDKANLLYFTPKLFGGNKKDSFTYFEKAISKIESSNETRESWFYLSLLILLSQHYEKQGHTEKAIATQKKLLALEPNLEWVKEEILSQLEDEEEL